MLSKKEFLKWYERDMLVTELAHAMEGSKVTATGWFKVITVERSRMTATGWTKVIAVEGLNVTAMEGAEVTVTEGSEKEVGDTVDLVYFSWEMTRMVDFNCERTCMVDSKCERICMVDFSCERARGVYYSWKRIKSEVKFLTWVQRGKTLVFGRCEVKYKGQKLVIASNTAMEGPEDARSDCAESLFLVVGVLQSDLTVILLPTQHWYDLGSRVGFNQQTQYYCTN